ncbi:response regulator transcription factor [Glaciihabitans sp. dw_435]|uniref:response regulator transcription factor n=1 Tax=Glaciihabitans sp. dw_435 TaxID=2720081 RepID=UPI001BD1EE6C|nr:response regulator transcription factor [Glaciihabitans sp. dw_435]
MTAAHAGQPSPTIRVLVADDQAIVRDGLVTILSLLPDIEIVGEAADGEEAVRLVRQLRPDVVLMDLRMPRLDGAAATALIVAELPATAVLVLTTYADDASIVGALRGGARGYLTKDAGRADLSAAIRSVARGQTTFSAEVGALLIGGVTGSPVSAAPAVSGASVHDRFPVLTAREAEVLGHIAEGLSNPEIAERMYVSVTTVKTYINAIFAKLALRDRSQAIALVLSSDEH